MTTNTETIICTHRWAIETPSGPTSPGTCRLCGATKLFQNSNEDFTFTEYRGALQSTEGSREYQREARHAWRL